MWRFGQIGQKNGKAPAGRQLPGDGQKSGSSASLRLGK
jgi:hypothetical protein